MTERSLSCLVPRREDLTPKQRRRIRDLLAFVHATGQSCRGLVAKHAAGTTLLFGTDYDLESRRAVVHSQLLSDYDVENHPFVKLHPVLEAAGYMRTRPRSRPQQYIRYRRLDDEHGRNEITIRQVSVAVWLNGQIPVDVVEDVREYAADVGARCYDDRLEERAS